MIEQERLYVNDKLIELATENSQFSRTLQVNDLVSLDNRQTNFTKNIKIPKTPKNVLTMDFLGVVGNSSNVPYQRNIINYFVGNEAMIYNGWGVINETNNFYNLTVYDGNLDLYKSIENAVLSDLDLSDISHAKTVDIVVSSMTNNLSFKYILADYNGKTMTTTGSSFINTDYLIPSIKVSALWDKIFIKYGYTYSGTIFSSEDFQNLWLTYPKGITETIGVDVFSSSGLTSNINQVSLNNNDVKMQINSFTAASGITVSPDNLGLIANENMNIQATFVINPSITNVRANGSPYYAYATFGGETFICDGTTRTIRSNFLMNAGFKYVFSMVVQFNNYNDTSNTFQNPFMSVNLKKSLQIDFVDELKGFKLKDFLNEIIWRFGVTPYKNKYTNNYIFKTLGEVLTPTNAIDWSTKFQSETNEKYIYLNYAQKNNLKYKYNDTNSNYNDGALNINNVNIADSTTMIQSAIYSPEASFSNVLGFQSNVYKLWDKVLNNDGTVKYTSLQNRFYFMRSAQKTFATERAIGSEALGGNTTILSAPVENFSGLSFNEIVNNYYQDFSKVLNNSKIITASFNLKYTDIIDFDFSKLYFIKQLGGYFLINKITNFQIGKQTQVELIHIKLI